MATDKFTAAESIRRLALMYSAMGEAADALEAMGKIEQSTTEAGKAKDAAESARDAALDEVVKAKAGLAKVKDQADGIVAKANDQALATLGEADRKAAAIVDGATAQAASIVSEANAKAGGATAAVAGNVAQLTTTKLNLERDVASLTQAAAAKQAETEALETRLAKAQASIAKLLG